MNRALCRQLRIWAVMLLVTGCVTTVSAQQHLSRSTAASGCVAASDGSHRILGTIGQSAIGTAKNSTQAGFFGFWYNHSNTTVDVKTVQHAPSADFELIGMYPQPTRNHITCVVRLPGRGSVQFAVYGILGNVIQHGSMRMWNAGTYRLQLTLPPLPSGIYLLQTRWNSQTRTQRLTVLH